MMKDWQGEVVQGGEEKREKARNGNGTRKGGMRNSLAMRRS